MGRQLGAQFFRGREPIDAIWATSDLKVVHACIMPVGYSVRDHCFFVLASMIGTCLPKILCPALRRLNTKITGCALWYNRVLQKNILHQRLLECMIHVAESEDSKEVILAKLNQLNHKGEQYMKHVEKKFRQIKSRQIPFSPEALLWIYIGIPLTPLVACQKESERGNLKRTVQRSWINLPFFLSVEE